MAITPGLDMQRGAELAVSEINGAGGFTVGSTTYDFELMLGTTSGPDGLPDTAVAATNINKLIVTNSVVAILGGFRTEVVLGAIQPSINASMMPFLGVGSTAPIITEYYYRVGPVNETTLTRNLIAFYLTEMASKGVTDVVVVREDAPWSATVSAGLKPTLQIGGLLDSANFTFGTDVVIADGATGPEIATVLATVPSTTKALLTLFTAPVGKAVTEQWVATGMSDDTYLAGINMESQKNSHIVDTDGVAVGEIFLDNAPPGEYPTFKTNSFINSYLAVYGATPTYTSYVAYDSVYIIKEAILNSNSFASSDIHAELPNTDYIGTSSRIKFTSEPSAGQVATFSPIFDVYNNTIVHDLFTPSTFGVSGSPYAQVYFSQWNSDSLRKAVWHGINLAVIEPPPYDTTIVTGTEITTIITETTIVEETHTTIIETTFTTEITSTIFVNETTTLTSSDAKVEHNLALLSTLGVIFIVIQIIKREKI